MIRQFLTLSSSHLTAGTQAWLRQEGLKTARLNSCPEQWPAFMMGSMPHGWFCWTGMEEDHDNLLALPNDLQTCIRYAKSRQCECILFDEEGTILEGLEIHG